jgi:hypothetical protein
MASAVGTQKFLARNSLQIWDHDPGSTNAILAGPDGGTTIRYVDLRDYDHFVAAVAAAALTGSGPTKLEIVASDTVTFTNVVVIKDSGAIVCDALAEWAVQECSAEEVQHLATTYNLRYVAARITCQNAADEATVVYIARARRPHLDLTAAANPL